MRGTPNWFTTRHRYVDALHKAHGGVVKLVLPAGKGVMIHVRSPKVALPLVFGHAEAFPTRPRGGFPGVPFGLFSIRSVNLWRTHRQAIISGMSTAALRDYQPKIQARASQLCGLLSARGSAGASPVDVYHPLTAATLDVIGDIGFGVDLKAMEDMEESAFAKAGQDILAGTVQGIPIPLAVQAVIARFPVRFQPAFRRRLLSGVATFSDVASQVYYAQAASASSPDVPGHSLLRALAAAKLSFAETRDEIITLLVAGHETTSNTLCWALKLLAEHPQEQARARAEAEAALHAAGDGPLGLDAAVGLSYLKAVFYEALRLYPTVPTVGRLSALDVELEGMRVPAGTVVVYSIAAASVHEAAWGPDALDFRPDRHLAAAAPDAAWLPFGGGARKCIGYRLAELEAVTFLAVLLRHFDVEPAPEGTPPPEELTDLTLGPKTGLRLCLVPLVAAATTGTGLGPEAGRPGVLV